ncbi:MAG: Gldg family protein [Clostridia bacterium]|nr:Gldg family protein [Clostridia bacterium]
MNKLFSSQRARKNWINAGIIALVIAIVIMLNAIVTVLGDKFNWHLDMTDEQIYTISDALKETLKGANMDVDVEVIFTCAEDYARNNFSNLSSGDALAYVHSTATQIAKEYKNVHISYHDNAREPEFFKNKFTEIERFLGSIENPVIIARRTYDKEGNVTYGTHFKVYAARSFYGFSSKDSSLYAYNGEKVFASAILSLTLDEMPAVYFTTGHSERLYNAGADDSKAPVELINLFYYCGFKVEELNLSLVKDENSDGVINASDIPSDARMIVINEPEFDFSASEISILDDYMLNKGSIMIFASPDNRDDNSRLLSFLETRCGVTTNTEDKVTDAGSNLATDKFSFRGEISSNNAANMYLSYLSNATSARPFFTNSTSVSINEKYMSDDGTYEGDSYIFTLPLFQTANSGKYNGVSGNHYVMSVSSILKGKNDNEAFSYLVYCPSSGFASDEALQNQAYPNEDIILSLVHSMTSAQTTVELDYKAFANYDLDITENQAKTATVILSVVLPLCVVAVGAVLLIRRKHR